MYFTIVRNYFLCNSILKYTSFYNCVTFPKYCFSKKAEEGTDDQPDLKYFLKKNQKTPIGKLDELGKHPYTEKEPLSEFKDGVNPETGEVGGPRGPEPTRFGDWERKGRVTDF